MPYGTFPDTEEERKRARVPVVAPAPDAPMEALPPPVTPGPRLPMPEYGSVGGAPGAFRARPEMPWESESAPPSLPTRGLPSNPLSVDQSALDKPAPRPTPTGFWGRFGAGLKGALYGAAMGGPGGMIAGGIIGGRHPGRIADYEYRTQDLPQFYAEQKRQMGEQEQKARVANIETDNARADAAEARAREQFDWQKTDRKTLRDIEERKLDIAERAQRLKEHPADKWRGKSVVRDENGVESEVAIYERLDGTTYTKPLEGVSRQPRPEKPEKITWDKANKQAEAEYNAGTVDTETELKQRILDQVGPDVLNAANAAVDPSDPEAVAAQRAARARIKEAEAAAKRDMDVKRKGAIARRVQELMGGPAPETRTPSTHVRDKGLLAPPR